MSSVLLFLISFTTFYLSSFYYIFTLVLSNAIRFFFASFNISFLFIGYLHLPFSKSHSDTCFGFPVIYSQFILNIFKFKFTNSWDYFGLVPSNSPIHRLHTGDQPYPCTACGEGFRTKAELNQHNRATHGGINPNSANTTIVVSGSQQQQMVSNILRIRIRTISNIISVFDE